MPKQKQNHPTMVTIGQWCERDACYASFTRMPLAEWQRLSTKRRASPGLSKEPIGPRSLESEQRCRTLVKSLEEFFARSTGAPRRRAMAFCRWFCGEKMNMPTFEVLSNAGLEDAKNDLTTPLPPPRNVVESAKHTLKLLRECFEHFPRNLSADQMAVELCRSLPSISVSFPENAVLEQILRDEKIVKEVTRSNVPTTRRRLSQLHGISRESLARICRNYARDVAKQVERERGLKPDVDRLFGPEKQRAKAV